MVNWTRSARRPSEREDPAGNQRHIGFDIGRLSRLSLPQRNGRPRRPPRGGARRMAGGGGGRSPLTTRRSRLSGGGSPSMRQTWRQGRPGRRSGNTTRTASPTQKPTLQGSGRDRGRQVTCAPDKGPPSDRGPRQNDRGQNSRPSVEVTSRRTWQSRQAEKTKRPGVLPALSSVGRPQASPDRLDEPPRSLRNRLLLSAAASHAAKRPSLPRLPCDPCRLVEAIGGGGTVTLACSRNFARQGSQSVIRLRSSSLSPSDRVTR